MKVKYTATPIYMDDALGRFPLLYGVESASFPYLARPRPEIAVQKSQSSQFSVLFILISQDQSLR